MRRAAEIRIVAFVVACEGDARAVVKLVIPQSVEAEPALFERANQSSVLMLVFGDDDDLSRSRFAPRLTPDCCQDMIARCVENLVSCVKPQTVKVEFLDPIPGIGGDELTDRPAVRAIEIDCVSPIRLGLRDIVRREL